MQAGGRPRLLQRLAHGPRRTALTTQGHEELPLIADKTAKDTRRIDLVVGVTVTVRLQPNSKSRHDRDGQWV